MNVLTECLTQGTSPVGVVCFGYEYFKKKGFLVFYLKKNI